MINELKNFEFDAGLLITHNGGWDFWLLVLENGSASIMLGISMTPKTPISVAARAGMLLNAYMLAVVDGRARPIVDLSEAGSSGCRSRCSLRRKPYATWRRTPQKCDQTSSAAF